MRGKVAAVALSLAAGLAAASGAPSTDARAAQFAGDSIFLGLPFIDTVDANATRVLTLDVPLPFTTLRIQAVPTFGNPDIYVTIGAGSTPSPTSFHYASTLSIGSEAIVVPARDSIVRQNCLRTGRAGESCTVRIAVRGGVTAAGFTLIANADGRSVYLPVGFIVPGVAEAQALAHFFYVPAPATPGSTPLAPSAVAELSFAMTVTSGSAALFLASSTVGGWRPSPEIPTSYCASFTPADISGADAGPTAMASGVSGGARGSGGSSVIARIAIGPEHPCYCGANNASDVNPRCIYYVAVAAMESATFTLLATDTLTPTIMSRPDASALLLDGMSQESAVVQGDIHYYDFAFAPAASTDATQIAAVTLSSYYGSITMYALLVGAGNVVTPTAANAHYTRRVVDGSATLTIARADTRLAAVCGGPTSAAVCRLRIAVVNNAGARSSGSGGGFRGLRARELQASASPAATPSPAPAASPAPFAYAGYAIIARTTAGGMLTDGNPLLVQAAIGQMVLFRYTHTSPGASFVITTSPISGSLDIYVGVASRPATVPPTRASFAYRAMAASASSALPALIISGTDAASLECAFPCTYIIGVTPSAFADGLTAASVLVRTRDITPAVLLDGQATVDAAIAGDSNYYTVSMPVIAPDAVGGVQRQPVAITISLSNTGLVASAPAAPGTLASSQFYVRVGDGRIEPGNPATYNYASAVSLDVGNDVSLRVVQSDGAVQAGCPTSGSRARAVCSLTVLVVSNSSSVYSLVASTGNRLLQDGVPMQGAVATGETLYYTFVASSGVSHVQFSLTPLSGAPAIYVSTRTSQPTSTNYEYTAGGFQLDTITIDDAAPICANVTATAGGSGVCAWYIAVTTSVGSGVGGVARFRLQATSSRVASLTLSQPTTGRTRATELLYYSLFVPDTPQTRANGLEIVADALTGGFVSLLVSNTVDDATLNTQLPTAPCGATGCDLTRAQFATWSTIGVLFRTRLLIAPTDSRFRVGVTYIIAVSSSSESDFTVTATIAGSASVLATGLPTEDSIVSVGDTLYYRAIVSDNTSAVLVQALPYAGELAIYVSLSSANQRPSSGNAAFTAGILESYRIDIPATALRACDVDPIARTCSVYIAVTALTAPLDYSIVATVEGGSVPRLRLIDGRVARGAVMADSYTYFFASVNVTAGTALYLSLTEIVGDVAMYVSAGETLPSRDSYGIAVPAVVGTELVMIAPGSPLYMRSGILTIAVYGMAAAARFYISFSTGASVIAVNDGVPMEGAAPLGRFAYYSFAVGANPGDVTMSVTPLSGQAQIFGSRWRNPNVNTAFRPTNLPGGFDFSSTAEGALVIPAGGRAAAACPAGTADCVYIFAVWCDNTYPSPVDCAFIVTPTTANGNLVRLADGVPVRAVVAIGEYHYYLYEVPRGARNITFNAGVQTGSVRLLVSDAYIPGVTPAASLPRLDRPGSYGWLSQTDFPVVTVNQLDAGWVPGSTDTRNGSATSTSVAVRLYTVAVLGVTGPATYSLSAASMMTPLLLPPGQVSAGHTVAGGKSLLFAIDVRDVTIDIIVTVTVLSGRVGVSVGSRGSTPRCNVVDAVAGTLSCTGARWQASSGREGVALLRIPARRPCNTSSLIDPATCNPGLDWAPGIYVIAITGFSETLFSISAGSASGYTRLIDGQPTTVSQPLDAPTSVLLYQILPEPGQPDLRITFAPLSTSASLRYYISSCVDDVCTDADERPSATSYRATGWVESGARTDVVISRTSPAYCSGNAAAGHVCNYFITLVPDRNSCTLGAIAAGTCTVVVTITPTLLSASATVLVDYATLKDKQTMFSTEAAPNKVSRYYLYVQSEADVSADLFLRLEACDTMAGFVVAYFCENPASYTRPSNGTGVNGRPFCVNPRSPGPSDWQMMMSTTPDTEGGEGRSRLSVLGTPARLVHAGVTVPNPPSTYAAASARFGASTYEMLMTLGNGLYMKQPTRDGVGALRVTIYPADNTIARLEWTPPLVLNDSSLSGWAFTSYAVNVTYRVFVSPGTFAASVARATNTTVGAAGIVATTACGLERWERLVAPNITTVYTTTDTSMTLTGLSYGIGYDVNVVAICDDDCLRHNAAVQGYATIPTALSSQRVPYAVVRVQTIPPIVESLDMGNEPDAFTSAVVPIGVVLVILLAALLAYVGYKQASATKARAEAEARAKAAGHAVASAASARFDVGGGGTVSPRGVTRENADELFRPRSPAVRRALVSQSTRAVSEAESMTASLTARYGGGGGGGSSGGAGAKAGGGATWTGTAAPAAAAISPTSVAVADAAWSATGTVESRQHGLAGGVAAAPTAGSAAVAPTMAAAEGDAAPRRKGRAPRGGDLPHAQQAAPSPAAAPVAVAPAPAPAASGAAGAGGTVVGEFDF